jgi:hypothetical protein
MASPAPRPDLQFMMTHGGQETRKLSDCASELAAPDVIESIAD